MQSKIVVVGMGYVGCSLAVLLARQHIVTAVDIDEAKINKLNQGISPIDDRAISEYLRSAKLQLVATTDSIEAMSQADVIIVATPTNYDVTTGRFDTKSVETVIKQALKVNDVAIIVIKSTVPIGFTAEQNQKHRTHRIIFSPEFLREGQALHDNLYPSRIIVSGEPKFAEQFSLMLKTAAQNSPEVFCMGSTEAEAVKLFANNYLAMRVAFFNELDTYAETHGLDSGAIIRGVSADPRIGDYYNNPSFGYGGYCLPKDTKQLATQFSNIPSALISAIVQANTERLRHITEQITRLQAKTVGIYRLVMKSGSENFRQSAIWEVIETLHERGISIIVHEPLLLDTSGLQFETNNDLGGFASQSDIIIANRVDEALRPYLDKVYSRDIYSRD